ncbi:MAG TPA: hypothetical protein VHO90_14380 [Bacteroidales bacterium]|nr:hypothetical protein [Bacteroidales bacterium]
MIAKAVFNRLPQLISCLLHPLLMPLYGLLILFNSGTYISFMPYEFKKSVFLIVGICTLGIPLVFIPFFLYRKVIANIQMNSQQERIGPLVVTTIMFYFSYFLMSSSAVPKTLQLFLLGSTICVAATLIITIKWKISAHMIGLGGVVGLIVSISLFMHSSVMSYLVLFLILSGMAGTSRLLLNSHSPAQIYTGFALGFFVMFITIFIF